MRLSSLALVLFSGVAFAQTPMDKTMVVVNGQSIDGKTYYKRMEVMPNVGSLVNNQFVQATPGYLAISKLIDETLMLQLAKEKGVAPTDAEVDAKVKEQTTKNPSLIPSLEKIGFTIDDFKYDIRIQMAEYKLQVMGINITDQEVEKFYSTNQKQYVLPKRYALRVIAVDAEEKKKAVDAALNSGQTFGKVAREQSLDLSKANDGDMGEVSEKSLAGSTATAVMSTKKGSATDWISNGEIFVKFFVEDILPEKTVPLDAELRAGIRQNMMLDKGRIKNNLSQMMNEMRKRAKIDFQGTIFDSQLKSSFGKS